ncbi:MAG: polysaccharide deacetylase family protein [Chloroflexi bacterium]|nr:polysaccharide deacetylase family protein [Chloroflexota bacterium]
MRRCWFTIRPHVPWQWQATFIGIALGMALVWTAEPARGQVFQPNAPADAPAVRTAACRPSTPAVGPVPGRSIVVERGPAECQTVALTFDAGADRGYAELILDILREQQVPASFGMTGIWAEKNPDLVRRIVDDGHELINHTWDHGSFTGFSPRTPTLGPAERRDQLDRTNELVVGLTGTSTRPYFRPPYGDLNDGVLKDVSDNGYDYTIMWTVDSLGWNHLPAAGIVERCLSRAAPGAIYIFHVGADSQDAQALGTVIAGLREQGYGFVTITDLLGL